jgi:hypothetical protein
MEKGTKMTFFSHNTFLKGIALGGICGIIIGSVIAVVIGESNTGVIRQAVQQKFPVRREVPFKYLAQ